MVGGTSDRESPAAWFRPRWPGDGRGFYESFYLKANHPERRLALWLKFNLLEPRRGRLGGEVWGVWFDGERGYQRVAHLEGEPRLGEAAVEIDGCRLALADGVLRESARLAGMAWEVRLVPLAEPIVHLPSARLYSGELPRKKIVTPVPLGRLDGWFKMGSERVSLDGWRGFFGRNWGREHARTYAYGNAAFPDGALLDGFSARLRMGPLVLPPVSIAVLRTGGSEYRFDRPRQWLSGRPTWNDHSWNLELPGSGGHRLRLAMEAPERDFVRLVYRQPAGGEALCFNTKFACCRLSLTRAGKVLYEGETGSAELETLRPSPRQTP